MAGRGKGKTTAVATRQTTAPAGQAGMQVQEGATGVTVEKRAELAAIGMAARERAKVEASYVMAARFPRDEDQARLTILDRCKDKEFATAALYQKPIGGGSIVGFSIRFVEELLRLWGNIEIDVSELYDSEDKKIVRVSVRDYQTNFPISREFTLNKTVERKNNAGREVLGQRTNSAGVTTYIVAATEDEMLTKESAQVSKAIRQIGLRLLPAALKAECDREVRKAGSAQTRNDPDAAKKGILDGFHSLGVSPKDIEGYLGVKVKAISPKQLEQLRRVYTGIKEGHTTWADVIKSKSDQPAKPEESGGPSPDSLFAGDQGAHQGPQQKVK